MCRRSARLWFVFALAALPAAAQLTLTTSYAGTNGQSGTMFDVTAINPIVIDSLDCNISTGATVVEVYVRTGGGSYLPVANTAAAWTLLGTTPVTAAGTGLVTPIPLVLNINVPSGQTQGIYVTTTNSTMWYTNGVAQGLLWASDANLQVFEGHGVAYPFNAAFVPRDWNGTIHYHQASNLLVATTSGGGVGDLVLGLTMITAGANEGYLLVSSTATGPLGGGPFLGIYPDGVTFALLQEPLNVGDPLHFVVGPTGVFPDQQFLLPAGALLLGGQTWDAVAVVFGSGFTYLGRSNVQRLVW